MAHDHAIGIDIGGTGIKGAVVDLKTGELKTDRIKVKTPEGGKPNDILAATAGLLDQIATQKYDDLPIGVCFPAVVKKGRTLSAANVSKEWIGLPAEELFEKELKRDIHFINDADAAGLAELRYGAARKKAGLIILTTLGTGIGSAFLYDGVLIPNTEIGHIEIDGKDAEALAAYSALERDQLSWEQWAANLQLYYNRVEALFSPDLIIVGGGVSKHSDEFLPLLKLSAEIVPAVHRNNAGIIGAASLAS